MKYKTSKLKKLEKERYSILTQDLSHCIIHKDKKADDINEIFMGRNRLNSMKYGLCIPLCRYCHRQYHNDRDMQLYWMKKGLEVFLQDHTIEDFRDIFLYIKGLDLF
jgi:hypothetical protein